jgi:hypothetical protein
MATPPQVPPHVPSLSRAGARGLLCLALTAAGLSVAALTAAAPAHAAGGASFVQQVTGHGAALSVPVTLPSPTVAGNRLVVEVGVWNSGNATTSKVTDDAGDTFVKLLSYAASEHTEMSVWTAVVATGGTRPKVTATATSSADLGVLVLEYSGLSTVADATVLDKQAHASGTTGAAATVSSGSTTATSADGELALGLYADSGFMANLTPGSGYTQRANLSPTGDMELLAEDRVLPAGSTVSATAGTGASTTWLMAVLVLRAATVATPTAPAAPGAVNAVAGNASATVTWSAPGDGGSPITSYTVTPYIGGVAQPVTTVTGTPPATTATVAGLTNGTAYTFRVAATNAIGTGPTSAATAPVTPSAPVGGTWGPLQTWPIVALSNTLLYNGNLVAWDGWQQPQPSVITNPATPTTFTTVNAPDSVFCDGAASLPDGRLLVVGGYGGLTTGQLGIVDTTIFNPATNAWSRVADMHMPRWYPSVTELADGRYVAISGNSANATVWADTPEVYDPGTNTWTLLPGVSTPQVHEDEYPFSYLLPSGKVFTIGPNEDNSFLLDVNAQTWAPVGGASGVHNGSSVMYRPGKVLYSGGGVDINAPGPSFNTSAVIDLTAANPAWQQIAPMNNARVYHTLTMLPDGKVLAVGGSSDTDQGVVTTGVLKTEIWDPATQTWTVGPSMAAARNYHSTALLMPDGRILVAGGGHSFGPSGGAQYSAQYYSPAYLSNGPRPTITSATGAATYGGTIAVSTPDAANITAVNLVSLGADTHQLDMNQHFVPLGFTASGGSLTVQAPATAALAPPGYYMLFILNDKGVPSVASMVHIGQSPSVPSAPSSVAATAGDGSATVSWTAPNSDGSPITGYTVTPYAGSVAQAPVQVAAPATSTVVSGLTNGTAYTFTVTATNAAGTSPASAPSNVVTPGPATAPAFVQQASAQAGGAGSLSVSLPVALGPGNRLVVQVGVWGAANPLASGVTDSAGDTFTEVAHWTASDHTEVSVWTAPVTAGAGGKPTITVQVSGTGDIGVQALEYRGVSSAVGAGAVDQVATASGTTGAAATVQSGQTAAVSAGGGLAIGFYGDSGFGHPLTGGSGWTVRGNMSPNGNMDLLAEDQPAAAGSRPNATVGAGASTVWLLGTVVFKPGTAAPPTAPGTPTGVTATAGSGSAMVTWTAPADGGSAISSYTVTPYIGAVAQTPLSVPGIATSTTVSGLANGTAYTFTVSATNAVGASPASTPSNVVTPVAGPAFVQQAAAQALSRTSLAAALPSVTTRDNRLIVLVGVWSAGSATVSTVTDNAGDTFTKLTAFTASDHTQLSVWTAVVATGGTKPTVTATATGSADIGVAVTEYSGLSTVAGTAVVDQSATGTGTTGGSAQLVRSAQTGPATADGELALGFYVDSGFGTGLTGGAGYATRTNLSPNGSMDLLVEDAPVSTGGTPSAGVTTGASTMWLMATIVFKHA